MQIRNRLFSYPVYSNDVDDYKINSFSFEYDIENNGDFIKIIYFTKILNENIIHKIREKVIKLTILIECPKTAYRQLFILDELKGDLEIPSQILSSKVEICCLLIANSNFIINKECGISSDYLNTSFSIKKGFIIGYDNAYPFIVDKVKEDNFKPSSIISVVKKLDLDNQMDIDLDNDQKIKIQLGKEMYRYFVQLQGQDKLPIVHSLIVLPALVYVISQIKDVSIRETYEEYYWYRCIAKQLEILNIDIDSSVFKSMTALSIAQELLKCPLKKALVNLTTTEGGD
ncbi:hypothetical protein [Thomasclavelia ramosa]|uniref:hypothetical protein n=1 Tax=Thomasclavelia ramosa TaxID=1547 RepID=UPI001D08B7E6|nr:hypothetical protein [Thomasclavelia ramosa]MCB6435869.1 hypothetical protein [Thomasclavelia ramosa]MCB6458918.1 hypothetical protein [Thomasclavelia ramosa]MCB6597102.1 hypothetical protein [Thomasclavelia ramosa]MCB6600639.1 hypothetical protein [Thomasclavelia ramosa]MCB6618682.1 hypothetical protein [Thomasclavelia ramosa]